MKWHVSGADAASGADRKIAVDAPDEAQARELAKAQGILVETVSPVQDLPKVRPVIDYGPSGHGSLRRRIAEQFRMGFTLIVVAVAALLMLGGSIEMRADSLYGRTEQITQLMHISGGLKLIAGLLLLIWLTLLFYRSKSGDK